MDAIFEFGLGVTRWMQSTYPQLTSFFEWVSALGREEFYLAFLPLIYWCLDKKLGKRLAYLFLMATGLNGLFKHGLRGPRPFWLDNSVQLSAESSYGAPSGHVQLAATVYLLLAGWFKRSWGWLLAVLMIILMGFSRVYLGVHFVHDVFAGLGLAILLLVGYLIWERRFAAGFHKRILGQKLLAGLLVPLILTAVYLIVRLIIGEADTGVAWAAFAPEAELEGLESVATAVGALLGAGIGLLLEGSRVRFRVDGPVWQRALRFLFGMAGAVAVWGGLRAVFPADPLWLAIPLRIIRYGLTLFWIGYTAPYLFVRLRLAQAEPDPGIQMTI